MISGRATVKPDRIRSFAAPHMMLSHARQSPISIHNGSAVDASLANVRRPWQKSCFNTSSKMMSTWNVEVCRPVDMPLPYGAWAEPGLCQSNRRTAVCSKKRAQRHKWFEYACQESEKSWLVEIIRILSSSASTHRLTGTAHSLSSRKY